MFDLVSEPVLVALVGLGGGILLGLAARMGRFCTLGAIEDTLYGSSTLRLRMWGIAIGVAIFCTFALSAMGLVDLSETLYLARGWSPAASILGGLLFGYGMALAGNCGFGALARLGGGDMRAFMIVIVMGISAYVVLNGPLAGLRLWAFGTPDGPQSTASFAHLGARILGVNSDIIGLLIGAQICALALTSQQMRAARSQIAWGAVVGIAIASGWAGTAWVARAGFDALPVVSHSFTAPIGQTLLYAMTSSGDVLSFGIGSVVGVVCGAILGSLIKGHFRWEACDDPRELRRQLLGAALMGLGAVLALGCSVGQGISAFSVLAYSAPVTLVAIFAGAAIGLRQLIVGFSRSY